MFCFVYNVCVRVDEKNDWQLCAVLFFFSHSLPLIVDLSVKSYLLLLLFIYNMLKRNFIKDNYVHLSTEVKGFTLIVSHFSLYLSTSITKCVSLCCDLRVLILEFKRLLCCLFCVCVYTCTSQVQACSLPFLRLLLFNKWSRLERCGSLTHTHTFS